MKAGNHASASNAAATSSVPQLSGVLENPPKASPGLNPFSAPLRVSRPNKNPIFYRSRPSTLHSVQRQKDESHYLDTSYMLPALASMVQKYLPSTNAKIFPIFPNPLKIEVPRAFLRAAYGGAAQQWLQIFRKDKHPKGAIERRVVFPQFGLNPAMPNAPGHPGLMFASRHEILENPPWTVFRKGLTDSGKAVWLYLGDYECELVGMMTAQEFSSLAISVSSFFFFRSFSLGSLTLLFLKVKSEWAKALLVVKQFDVYVSMRARIALRKHGCIPLEDNKKEGALINKEMDAIKANKGRPVDAADIISALERGDEVRLFFFFAMQLFIGSHLISENRCHPHDLYQIRPCFRERHGGEVH